MPRRHELPSVEALKALFSYDPETGVLTHRTTRRRGPHPFTAGDEAGHVNEHGYRIVSAEGRPYAAHRLVWKMQTGEEPPVYLDHRDRDRSNNRWENLRKATAVQNAQNAGLSSLNRHGVKGVALTPLGAWTANIIVAGKAKHLGSFGTMAEAAAAYEAEARERHGDFHNGLLAVMWETVLLVDEDFLSGVNVAMSNVIQAKHRAGRDPDLAAALDEIALDLADLLAGVDAKRAARMRHRGVSTPAPEQA